MIRCVRLWTGVDGNSHFRDGSLDITPGRNNDLVSTAMAATHATVEEMAGGAALAWHTAPVRQLVVTLSGTLIFTTRDGEEFTLRPGDVLLAEDTAGSGHQWRLSRAPIRGGACMWCSHPTPRFRSSGTESLGDP